MTNLNEKSSTNEVAGSNTDVKIEDVLNWTESEKKELEAFLNMLMFHRREASYLMLTHLLKSLRESVTNRMDVEIDMLESEDETTREVAKDNLKMIREEKVAIDEVLYQIGGYENPKFYEKMTFFIRNIDSIGWDSDYAKYKDDALVLEYLKKNEGVKKHFTHFLEKYNI